MNKPTTKRSLRTMNLWVLHALAQVMVARLKEQAAKTRNVIDDAIVDTFEALLERVHPLIGGDASASPLPSGEDGEGDGKPAAD